MQALSSTSAISVNPNQIRIANASIVFHLGYLGKPKAFQKNASHPFGFFNAHRFTKASFRHRFA
jgi:hypothetical protein